MSDSLALFNDVGSKLPFPVLFELVVLDPHESGPVEVIEVDKDLILIDGKTSRFVAGFLILSIALQI